MHVSSRMMPRTVNNTPTLSYYNLSVYGETIWRMIVYGGNYCVERVITILI